MKTKFITIFLGFLTLSGSVAQAAQLGTAINYQGRLTDGGAPANGTHSFRYRLVGDAAGTTQIGPVVDLPNQNVSGGLFNASLDFGAGAFSGQARWLEISVKPGGPGAAQDYVKLNPQPLPPGGSSQYARTAGDVLDGAITGPKLAPLSVTSGNLADGAVTSGKLSAGSVGSSQIVDGSITAADIANGQVVKGLSINGSGNLRDSVNLVAGANVTLSPNGNTVTISSAGPGGVGIWAPITGGGTYYNGGNVGIGTASPRDKLDVAGQITWGANLLGVDQGGCIKLGNSLGNGNRPYLDFQYGVGAVQDFNVRLINDADTRLSLYGNLNMANGFVFWGGADSSLSPDQGGAIRLGNSRGNGTTPYLDFHYGVGAAQDFNVRLINDSNGRLTLYGNLNTHGEISWETSSLKQDQGGSIELGNSLGNGNRPYLDFHYGIGSAQDFNVRLINDANGRLTCSGSLSVCTLTIYGGCDLAEPFPMKEEEIEKGSVVVIDEENPGQLKLSTRAYDTQVAGIVSGANGIHPGISLKQEGALDSGHSVALTGRVYVKADATPGAIKPGDLLTTSDTPGHAMKVTEHSRAQGAILGKAMSALKDGTGLVLVLVTLQ